MLFLWKPHIVGFETGTHVWLARQSGALAIAPRPLLLWYNIIYPLLHTPPNEPCLLMRERGYFHATWWEVLLYTAYSHKLWQHHTCHTIISRLIALGSVIRQLDRLNNAPAANWWEAPSRWEARNKCKFEMNSINGGYFVWISGIYKHHPAPRLETKCQTGAPSRSEYHARTQKQCYLNGMKFNNVWH